MVVWPCATIPLCKVTSVSSFPQYHQCGIRNRVGNLAAFNDIHQRMAGLYAYIVVVLLDGL